MTKYNVEDAATSQSVQTVSTRKTAVIAMNKVNHRILPLFLGNMMVYSLGLHWGWYVAVVIFWYVDRTQEKWMEIS